MNELYLDHNTLRDEFVGKGYKREAIVGIGRWSEGVEDLGMAACMDIAGATKESKVVGIGGRTTSGGGWSTWGHGACSSTAKQWRGYDKLSSLFLNPLTPTSHFPFTQP